MVDSTSYSGHYVVAGKKYFNKLEAYTEALQHGFWPHWNFLEEEFSQGNWLQEPAQTLDELYKQRAQDIRSRYDHVIVWFSGGADSDNVVRSFLHNNIHLDEIWHRSSFQRSSRTDKNTDSTNIANETRHAAIPLLGEYQKLNNKVKINLFDAMDLSMQVWEQGAQDPYQTNYFNPLLPAKQLSDRFTDPVLKNKKICKISGLDKPKIIYRDNQYWFSFYDWVVHTNLLDSRTNQLSNETDECFYWHPNAILVLIKQAHIIKNFFKKNPQLLWILDDPDTYNQLVKKLIYSHWDSTTWQAQKAKSDIDHEEFVWFYQNQESKAFRNWFRTAKSYSDTVLEIYKNVDPTLHNFKTFGHFSRLPGNYSRLYCLGV